MLHGSVDIEGRKQERRVTGEIRKFGIVIGDITTRGKIVMGDNTTEVKL